MEKHTINKIIAVSALLAAVTYLGAASAADKEVPPYIPVQGFLTNQSTGAPIDNPSVEIRFSLWDEQAAGTGYELWFELYSGAGAVSVADGFFTVYLGMINSLYYDKLMYYAADVSGIDPLLIGEPIDDLWLEVQVDPDAPMERVRLASVPFAEEAQYCHQIGDVLEENIQSKIDFDCGGSMFLRGWADGGPICEPDLKSDVGDAGVSIGVLEVFAGTGLDIGGTTEYPSLSAKFGSTAGTVSEGNHAHSGYVSDCDYCDTHNDSRYMPAGTIDHGETKGLGDDDHPQYFHLSQGQTVTGMTLFDPGATGTGAPFKVYSDYVVGNLNCDYLDGYTADDFSYDGHDHSGDYLVECADCNSAFVNKTGDTMTGQLDVSTSLDTAGAVHAFNGSAAGYGVFGNGYQYGVYGQNWSTTSDNAGVRGWAAGETGAVAGVIGQSSSSAGYGVKGEAFNDTGLNYGVFGTTASSSGFGVYGENTAVGGTGIFGDGNFGVSGKSSSIDGVGVYGLATAGSGTTFGVYGTVDSPDGWGVYSPDNIGTSGDYKYSNARTGYYIVTPADMAPNADGYNYARNAQYLVNQTGDQQFWNAPVHIPDGATITSLDVWATDYSTCLVRGTIWIQMIDDVSNCVESAVIGETNSSSTSTSTDVQLLSDTSITTSEELCSVTFDPRIVDHSGNTHYQLELWLNGGLSGCTFHRARITYTYDTVKP